MIDKTLLNPHELEYLKQCEEIRGRIPEIPWAECFVAKFCDWIRHCLDTEVKPSPDNMREETFGLPHPMLDDLRKILSGHSHRMTLVRYLAGKSLGQLAIDENSPHLKILDLCLQWDVFEGVADILLEKSHNLRSVEFCKHAVQWLNEHPSAGITGSAERSLFEDFYRHWREEKADIGSVWKNDWEYFWSHDTCVGLFAILLANKPQIFAPIIDGIQNPLPARNLFFFIYLKYDINLLSQLLKVLPSCCLDSCLSMPIWNHAVVLVPLLLPRIVESARMLCKSDREKFCAECGKILIDREDGLFLALNYIPFLHMQATASDDSGQVALTFLDAIVEAMEREDKLEICREWISEKYGKGFLSSTEEDFRNYLEIAHFSREKGKEMLDGITSFCRLLPDKVLASESGNILREAYKRLWAFENVISTSSHSSNLPDMDHEAIGSLYANSYTPAKSWLDDAKQLVSPAISSMEYSRNIETSLKLDSEINFHLAVGWQLSNALLLRKNYDEFLMTISHVANFCRKLYWLKEPYSDNFYFRILANLGTLVYAYASEKDGSYEALGAVKSFIESLPGIRHLSFEIFERLQIDELTMGFLRSNPEFLSWYKSAYENELVYARNEHWDENKRVAKITLCEHRLKAISD